MKGNRQNIFRKFKETAKILTDRSDQSRERQTFLLHFKYSVIEGFVLGVLALNEFVLLKALNGSNFQVGVLFQFTVAVLLISVIFNELLRRARRKRRMVLIVAVATRSPLLLLLLFPRENLESIEPFWSMLFLAVFFVFYLANPLIMPVVNLLLKHNYKHENYGKYYGYTVAVNKLAMLISTFLIGMLLDFKPYAYTFVYPALSVLGIWSIFTLTRIHYSPPEQIYIRQSFFKSVLQSFKRMYGILKRNRAFLDFEIGFILYGLAWLLTIAVIALFQEKFLELDYSSIAFYKNYYTTLSIVLAPFLGKLLGNIDPRKFGIYNFSALFLYLLFMMLTEYLPHKSVLMGIDVYWVLLLSFTAYGAFFAMMSLLWHIGSSYFSKDDEVADYQSIHLTLTGLRGIFAPLFGVWLLHYINYTGVFIAGMLFLLTAITVLYRSMKKRKAGHSITNNSN